MKQIYFFLVVLMVTSLSFGQGTEDFSNLAAGSSYSDGSFTGNNSITWTYTHSRDAVQNNASLPAANQMPALMLRRVSNNSAISSSIISGGIGDFTVKLYKQFTGGGDRQVELFVNGVSQGTSTPFDDYDEHIFTVSGINIGGDITIELKNVTAKQIAIDDISWTAFAGAAVPAINITAPTDGAVFTPGTTSVDVSVLVQNFVVDQTPANGGSGDGHIHWSIAVNGNTSVDQPMKYDIDPETIAVVDGNSYTVAMRLVDNVHANISPLTEATVSFSVLSSTQVTDIAALRAGTVNNYYELTSEALLTFQQNHRGQKFIEDASAGILIDDNAGKITTTYAIGDGITGIKGKLTAYQGMLQFQPTEDSGAASSTGNTVTPQTVTLADLTATPENYESELVKVVGVTMDNTTANFANNSVHALTLGADAFDFKSRFFDADYVTSAMAVPTAATDVTGIVTENSTGTYWLTARSSNDISQLLSVADNTIEGFNIYPNPARNVITVSTKLNQSKKVEIFNILGKRVLNTTTENTVNITSLQAGVYIVKVTENKVSATRKLIIK